MQSDASISTHIIHGKSQSFEESCQLQITKEHTGQSLTLVKHTSCIVMMVNEIRLNKADIMCR